MMSLGGFKEYLDEVVEKAFKNGVAWQLNGTDVMTMDEAIKQAQKRILEGK